MIYLTPEINKQFQSKQIHIFKDDNGFWIQFTADGYEVKERLDLDENYFVFVPADNKIVYKDVKENTNIALCVMRAYKALVMKDYKKFGEQLLAAHYLEVACQEPNGQQDIRLLNGMGFGAYGGRICSNGYVFICPPDKRELVCKS